MEAYGSLAPLYDRLTGDVPYEEFSDYYHNLIKQYCPHAHTLLDLGCGTGSLTALMSRRGYEMIAVDASPEMLSIARDKCAELQLSPQPLFLCQNMTELDLFGTVDAAYSSLDSINYLPGPDLPEVFELLHLFIEPGGLFIFDIHSPERLRALDGSVSVDEDEDMLCLWRGEFDCTENALFYGIDLFTRRGRFWQRSFEEHVEYLHEPTELKQLLEQAGFEDITVLSDGPQSEMGRLFILGKNKS